MVRHPELCCSGFSGRLISTAGLRYNAQPVDHICIAVIKFNLLQKSWRSRGVMETKSKGFSSRRYGILRRYAALFENATVYRF